jgi:cell division protein FtsW
MVASASITIADQNTGNPLYYFNRQLIFAVLGMLSMGLVYRTSLEFWEKKGLILLLITVVLLILVLVPGIGITVNGSSRWLPLGIFNLQVSELVKLLMIVYLAGYLVRQGRKVREKPGELLRPIAVVSIMSVLLLCEPDFGATAVLMATTLMMIYLGGVRLGPFILLILLATVVMALMAASSPERMERITSFSNPWVDPYESGFQLTQSLIAIGNGAWFGKGLGESIQKLFYLPEAHTDFLFAVLAEELGLLGVCVVIGLYTLVVWRCFIIGSRAEALEKYFGAHLCYGIGIWLALQAFINMGVNMGMLPTKGLTLPLMSAGGSSMLVTCVALGLVFRVQREILEIRMPSPGGNTSSYRMTL